MIETLLNKMLESKDRLDKVLLEAKNMHQLSIDTAREMLEKLPDSEQKAMLKTELKNANQSKDFAGAIQRIEALIKNLNNNAS